MVSEKVHLSRSERECALGFSRCGAQKLRNEAHLSVRRNDEVEARQMDFLRDHQP
jgi:hypothetical protein